MTVPVTITGEVVDTWCYASQVMGPGRGPKHKACALACVMGGVPPGILDDNGRLYICVKYKAYSGCNELLAPHVGNRVTITGHLANKGGVNVLKVSHVEPAAK